MGLVVLIIPASIANVRGGGDDDLAVVGRIRHRFLVPGHRGGKYGLTEGGAGSAEAVATEGTPIRKDEDCWGFISHVVAFLCLDWVLCARLVMGSGVQIERYRAAQDGVGNSRTKFLARIGVVLGLGCELRGIGYPVVLWVNDG